jgi:hypothetical protein
MKATAALVLAFLLCSTGAMAAETDSLKQKPLRYVFTVNTAMLFCGKCSIEGSLVAMPTTVHGIQYKKIRIGAGIGYTSYGSMRTMPYFGSLTYNLYGIKRKHGLFVELNYGGAHAWMSPFMNNERYSNTVTASRFVQISTGYAYHYEKLRLGIQTGFQMLQTERTQTLGVPYNSLWGDVEYVTPPTSMEVNYRTNRFFISLSIGI